MRNTSGSDDAVPIVATSAAGLNRGRPEASVLRVLLRGLRGRCPRCGLARLFERWHHVRPRCTVCGLGFEAHTGDTWFFMYVTTGGLTGALIVAMLLIRPSSVLTGQLVLIPAALALIGGTLPPRKGLAIAVDYLVSRAAGP